MQINPEEALQELVGSIKRVIERLKEQQEVFENTSLHAVKIINYEKLLKSVENDIAELRAYGFI